MSRDLLLTLSSEPRTRRLIQRLGLPIPLPQRLDREDAPYAEQPLRDRPVLALGTLRGELGRAIARALVEAGASPVIASETDVFDAPGEAWGRRAERLEAESTSRFEALVFDASELARAGATNDNVVAHHGRVHGAMIPCIEGLRFWPLEAEPARREVEGWLRDAPIPAEKLSLAAQASTLVGFDFLTSNWDRYSGANVGLDRTGARVLFIDNDAAFMEAPPREALEKNRARMLGVLRWSRGFVNHLRALDAAAITRVLGDEEPGRPLVSPRVVAGIAERTRVLLAHVDTQITARGEAATLFFP